MAAVLKLGRLVPGASARVLLKLEHLSLTGSHKDRVASRLVAEVAPGRTVVEASTGNMAIALASACRARGLGFVAVVPPGCTAEQRMTIGLFGAEVIAEPSLDAAIARARDLARERGAFHPDQFGAPAALEAIYAETVGREAAEVAPDVFVCGAGTGALLAGVARALPGARIVQVVPDGPIPGLSSRSVAPDQVVVTAAQAAAMAARLAREEGILAGPSTGAHVAAALELAARLPVDRRVLTLACDSGERYFSLDMEARA